MNENLNLVEILKDCHKGTKLYSMVHGEVILINVDNELNYPIVVRLSDNTEESFTSEGKLLINYDGECTLVPSRWQRDWGKFKPKDIKEHVKTFEDAVAILGNDNQAVIDYYAIADKTCTGDILAYAKLRVIAEALNEGWKPSFNTNECRYYSWFYLYTKSEYEKLDDDDKKICRIMIAQTGIHMRIAVSYVKMQVIQYHTHTQTQILVLGLPLKRENSLNIAENNL